MPPRSRGTDAAASGDPHRRPRRRMRHAQQVRAKRIIKLQSAGPPGAAGTQRRDRHAASQAPPEGRHWLPPRLGVHLQEAQPHCQLPDGGDGQEQRVAANGDAGVRGLRGRVPLAGVVRRLHRLHTGTAAHLSRCLQGVVQLPANTTSEFWGPVPSGWHFALPTVHSHCSRPCRVRLSLLQMLA